MTPEELAANRAAFAAELEAAKASGRLFRTEYRADGARFVHYLSDQEVAEAQARTQEEIRSNIAIDTRIRDLEAGQLLPRVTREVHLAVVVKDYMRERGVTAATAIAQLTDPAHAGYNLGFTKLKAFDDQIKALRAQRV